MVGAETLKKRKSLGFIPGDNWTFISRKHSPTFVVPVFHSNEYCHEEPFSGKTFPDFQGRVSAVAIVLWAMGKIRRLRCVPRRDTNGAAGLDN